ncbi:MAG: IS1634 family transposase [Firmicutes bacterium]|nr:IS1634 family transposase [Bacillota bacterium]
MRGRESVPVHLETVVSRKGGRTYTTHLLRTSYREGGKVKHRTVANVSDLPEAAIEALRRALRGEKLVAVGEAVQILASRSHGAVLAVLEFLRKIGLERMILSYETPWRKLVVAMIVARVIRPGSKLFTRGWWQGTTLPELLDLPHGGRDTGALYQALDELGAHQEAIERKLAEKHLRDGDLVLYDLSSSYLEGRTCPLAAFGYNRDLKRGKRQFNYGLLTTREGCPVAIELFPGDWSDPVTVDSQIRKLREKSHLRRIVLVGDRGMLTQARIEKVSEAGYGWITALRAPEIQRLYAQGTLQLSLLDERNIAEIVDPQRPGERLVVCRNPLVAEERARKREELLQATERELEKIRERVEKGRLKGADKIGLAVGRVIHAYKVAKHFILEIGEQSFSFRRNLAHIEKEPVLDGLYVIRSNVPAEEMDASELVRSYKDLQHVERAFRSLKTFHLEIRPVYHRLEERVRAHAFLCMLAYYVTWHMRRALEPFLHPQGESSLRGLLEELATIQLNTADIGGTRVDLPTMPDERQRQIFELLGVKPPVASASKSPVA